MSTKQSNSVQISRENFDAVIFDLDGVVMQTAKVNVAAWERLFDEYRKEREQRGQSVFDPFNLETDYPEYVDGKPRYDGVQSFLKSRQIQLEYGTPDDSPDKETICGLDNRKNRLFRESLERLGVQVYGSTVRIVRDLRGAGIRTAIISASNYCLPMLQQAGLGQLFDERVDGVDAGRLQLKGKPMPDVFREAVRRLGVKPERVMVVVDAIAGIQAGRAGGFRCVLSVDRHQQPGRLKSQGAHVVVADLAEVKVTAKSDSGEVSTVDLPSALNKFKTIFGDDNKQPAVFLDYDGTLSPIVPRPEDAVLDNELRGVIRRLNQKCPVAIVSGRGLDDVRKRVGLDEIVYAGSHGFEIAGPNGLFEENQEAQAARPALDDAEAHLKKKLKKIPGTQLERKKYSVATHFRNVDEARIKEVDGLVEEMVKKHTNLRRSGGKKVFELQPNVDWHKGRAVNWLLQTLKLDKPDILPVYLGDDLTDEDAFLVLRGRGIGIVVREEPRSTAAQYALENPAEVRSFLSQLLAELERIPT